MTRLELHSWIQCNWETFVRADRSHARCWATTFVYLLVIAIIDYLVPYGSANRPLIYLNIILIVLGAIQGGLMPGLFLGAASGLLIDYYHTKPVGQILHNFRDVISLLFFMSFSALMGAIAASLRNSYRREFLAKETATKAVLRRETILAVVCHELRNPLTIVSLGSKLIGDSVSSGNTESIPQRLEKIDLAVKRMSSLLRDLTDAAKADDRMFRLQREPLWGNEIVRDTVSELREIAGEKGIELVLEEDPFDRETELDRKRIKQVLHNLICNAIKFSEPGSRVAVSVRGSDEGLSASVTDSGPGIRAEDLPHIFDRRWQSGEVRAGEGAGLGLYIAKGIVEAHGGRLSVDSRQGRGARFSLFVPRPTGTECMRSL